MGRQGALIKKNSRGDNKNFRFTLNSLYLGPMKLKYIPDGYSGDEFSFTRNMQYFGIFRKYSQNELKFVKDGKNYVQACYEHQGSNAVVTVTVEKLNLDTLQYDLRYRGTLDFSTYKISELSADIQCIDGMFIDTIFSREDVKVDLFNQTSIDGIDLGPLEPSTILIPEMNINQDGIWELGTPTEFFTGHIAPMKLVRSDWTEAQTPDISGKFFTNATIAYANVIFKCGIKSVLIGTDYYDIKYTVRRYNSAGVYQEKYDLYHFMGTQPADPYPTSLYAEVTMNLAVGDYLTFGMETGVGTGAMQLNYTSISAELYKFIDTIDSRSVSAVLYHEAWDRLIAHYTGQKSKIFSTFFGRKNIGYADDGVIGALTTGMFIRKITGVNNTLTVCLKDLFESLSLYNIGLGLVDNKIRIEKMEYWFQPRVMLDVSDRINVMTIQKEVMPELLANSLQFGFNQYLYDKTGGIFEFNTSSLYTTILKLQNSFKLVSPYRADMTGILMLIKEADKTKDTNTDDSIYLLDMVQYLVSEATELHGPFYGYKMRTIEGFDYAVGGANTSQNFNLNLTPARTLRRWGSYIRAMLERWQGSYILWQNSDKSTTLKTKLTGEPEVAENAKVKISDLATPLWHPEKYIIDVFISNEEFNRISENPYGLIKIAGDKYGWILDAKCKNDNKTMELSLLRADLKYVTPII